MSSASPALRLALVFAFILLALGVAAGASVSLLVQAIAGPPTAQPAGGGSQPAAKDIGDQVCAAYVTQNYDALVSLIDPAPVQPSVPGAFDAGARAALETNLKALDSNPGKVTNCTSSGPTPGTGATEGKFIYRLVMTRGAGPKSTTFTHTIIMVKQPDGTLKIERDSDFHGIPTP